MKLNLGRLNKLLIYRKRLVAPYIQRVLKLLDVVCIVMSLLFIIALVYESGFRLTLAEAMALHKVYDYVWLLFVVDSLLRLVLDFRRSVAKYRPFAWCVNALLWLTIIPRLFSQPSGVPHVATIWQALDNHLLQVVLLATISLLLLSQTIAQLLNRRINPSTIIASSFFIFILIGTAMLMLPRATIDGISLIDALFMSTSAVCVTGLSTLDVASTFTPMGTLFILALIQVGGLGVMTLTSFFAMFLIGNSSFQNQVLLSDMVSSKSLGSIFTTLLYILGFTFIIELMGAVSIFLNIHNSLGMTLREEVWFSIFHSISAFCNAGFSTLPNNLGGELLGGGHNLFYLSITALVILGGIGFPILVNIYETLKYYFNEFTQRFIFNKPSESRLVHLYDLNTRIVVIMTLLLLCVSTIAIAVLEWNKGLGGMPFIDKMVHSLFNAACPRTAGFSSIAISSFSMQTLLIMIVLMMIGGGTQSTAGGIKVNVFAVVMLNLKAIVYGRESVTIFNRELSHDSIRRANSTFVIYLVFIALSIFALSIFEPGVPLLSLIFESVSALSTVGSSLDLTPSLGGDSKLVIIALMFIGRVGVLTIMSSLIKQRTVRKYKYPSGNIIIN